MHDPLHASQPQACQYQQIPASHSFQFEGRSIQCCSLVDSLATAQGSQPCPAFCLGRHALLCAFRVHNLDLLMPVLTKKGKMKSTPHTSQNVAFVAGHLTILQSDVQVDRLHVQAHQQLPGRIQCRLDQIWQDWLQHPLDNMLRCHDYNISVVELVPGLFDEVLPILHELKEACLCAGGR